MSIYDPFNIIHFKKDFIGGPPGTIEYTGLYRNVDITIDAIIYDKDSIEQVHLDDIDGQFDNNKIYWFNIIGLHNMDLMKKIGDIFNIHHMDLEDIVHVSQWSKIEKKDHYLFSVFKMIYLNNEKITHEHISIILKDNVLITFQETPGDVFDAVRERLINSIGRIRLMDIDYLYYSLIDALVDEYFVIINRISYVFNEIEMKIIDENISEMEQMYKLKKELVYLINAITPIKNSLQTFIKDENIYFKHPIIPYYADVMEHLNQINDSLKAYREMVNSLYEMQMANVSNDMNKTMMTLTIFSVIFIPLSFLAGVFGMNFTYIPGLHIHSAIYFFVLACLVIVVGMLSYFKIKKWY